LTLIKIGILKTDNLVNLQLHMKNSLSVNPLSTSDENYKIQKNTKNDDGS